jgi:hypothetical protein
MSYSSNNDYTNNVVQVKNALMSSDHSRSTNSHVNPVPLNLNLSLERIEMAKPSTSKDKNAGGKRKDLRFIDEETPSTSATPVTDALTCMKRTPTLVSIAPMGNGIPESITRSCSVGYLDNMDIAPSDVALSMLRKDTPYKRLVLVDKKHRKKSKRNIEVSL